MHIDIVPNRNSHPAILLRESYRDEHGKVKKRTHANLTHALSLDQALKFRAILQGPTSPRPNSRTPSTSSKPCPTGTSPPCSRSATISSSPPSSAAWTRRSGAIPWPSSSVASSTPAPSSPSAGTSAAAPHAQSGTRTRSRPRRGRPLLRHALVVGTPGRGRAAARQEAPRRRLRGALRSQFILLRGQPLPARALRP